MWIREVELVKIMLLVLNKCENLKILISLDKLLIGAISYSFLNIMLILK